MEEETPARHDALVFAGGSKIRAAALALAGCLTVGAPAIFRGKVVASVQPKARDFGRPRVECCSALLIGLDPVVGST